MSDLYQEIILEELRNPQNYGEMEDSDFVVSETNASCGDKLTIYIKLDDNKEKITHIKWLGQGCAISQATMSFISSELLGKTTAQIQETSKKDLESLLGIEEISLGRVKCLMLGLKGVQKSLRSL